MVGLFVWENSDYIFSLLLVIIFSSSLICLFMNCRLENEINSSLPLQVEPSPIPRELLLTLPTSGSILKITCNLSDYKNHLHLFNVGKWVKLVNIYVKVHAGLWCGAFTQFTKFRYTPNEDHLIIERQR